MGNVQELVDAIGKKDSGKIVSILALIPPLDYADTLRAVSEMSPSYLAELEGVLDNLISYMTILSQMAGGLHISMGEPDGKEAVKVARKVRKALGYSYTSTWGPNL